MPGPRLLTESESGAGGVSPAMGGLNSSVHFPPRPRPHGFTLLELLVVVSVIALLVALLLPAMEMAREAANTSVCGSNMKQIGMGLHLYVHDHDNLFPVGWLGFSPGSLASLSGNAHIKVWDIVRPYTGDTSGQIADSVARTYECPSDRGQLPGYPNGPRPGNLFSQTGSSYCFNTGAWTLNTTIRMRVQPPSLNLLWHNWGCWGRQADNFRSTARQVMLAEWSFYWLISQEWGPYPSGWGDGRWFVFHGQLGATPEGDDVKMNLAFVDGHVAFHGLRYAPDHYVNEDYAFASPPFGQ